MRQLPSRFSMIRLAQLAVLASPLITGCLPYGYKGDNGVGGSGGSLVAAVDGIDKSDRENDKVGFWLKCKSGVELKGDGATGDKVRFVTASQVSSADTCWLEVRMAEDEAAKLEWDWFGITKEKKKDVGLLYASTEDVVGDDRALTLTVYKLYAKKAPKPFKAIVKAKFDGIESAKIPAEGGAVGSLVCGDASEGGGVYKRDQADPTLATFTFENLDATKMRGVECQKLVVMVGAENKPEFEAELAGVSFPKPKKGDEYTFSKEGVPFAIKVKPQGGLDVDTTPGGLCLNKVEGQGCSDVRRVALASPENYLVVRVKGVKGQGPNAEVVTFLAGAGAGFGLFKKDELLLSDLKLKGENNEPAPFTYYLHSAALEGSVFGASFDEDFVKGTAFVSEKATDEDLADVTLLHIDRVAQHRLNQVDEAALDALPAAHWLVVLKAKKADQTEVEMVVGGKGKYLYSASAPAAGKYLDFGGLVADMKAAGATESERYAVYGLKAKAMAPAGCQLDDKGYLDLLAARHKGDLAPAAGDPRLDACEVKKAGFDLGLEGATVTAKTFYVWGWTPN